MADGVDIPDFDDARKEVRTIDTGVTGHVQGMFLCDDTGAPINSANPAPVSITGFPNMTVIASVLPTGAASAVLQADGNASLASIDSRLGAALPLPTGASTSALQTTGNTTLTDIKTRLNSTLDVQVLGAVLPSDASTATLQTAGNNSLTSIDSKLGQQVSSTYQPGYDYPSPVQGFDNYDPAGNLLTRSQVLTDEGTFRVNFANTSLAVSIGSPTRSGTVFTGGSLGSPTLDLHVGDYIKYDADGEAFWAQVESLGLTDAEVEVYAGASSSGPASRALLYQFTGSGGSLSVASGQLTMASGTTTTTFTGVSRKVDFAPLILRSRFSLSQRIANQDFHMSLAENPGTAKWFARFRFTGTTNTAVLCETGRNPTGAPSASETETTSVTMPAGVNSSALNDYRVELLTERVIFYINGVKVAEHFKVIPSQHDEMYATMYWHNTGVPASTSSAVVDYITGKNHNKIEIGVFSDTESIEAAIPRHIAFPYSVAGVIAINTDLLMIDCSKFASLSVQCTSMGTTGVVTAQWSNDPTFATVVTATILTQAGVSATTFNAAGFWVTPVLGQYFRLRLTTATTAGTTTLMVRGMATPVDMWLATQPVSGTVTVTSTRIAPNAADGHSTTHHLISAATTNATSVKGSAGAIGQITVTNTNAAARYFKLYNKATAPTVGTDTPIMTILLKPGETTVIGGNSPIRCSTGIAYALTTGQPVADTGAVAASEHAVGIFYT